MDFLKGLNKEQLEAVKYINGPIIVFAGAGTGKTKTLTTRIAYMIQEENIDPFNILAITFTKKATNEMKERINQMLGTSKTGVTISTIHALCAKILRHNIQMLGYKNDFEIIDDDDQVKIVTDIFKEDNINRKIITPRSVCNAISNYKNGMGKLNGITERVYRLYQDHLFDNSLVDFDDLLLLTKKLLSDFENVRSFYENRFKYILVDEFQDTNRVQYEIIRLLAGATKNVFVVGDDDQSIYSFRGASVDNMYLFMEEYDNCKVVKLVQNYRSSNILLKGSNSLIKCNEFREPKELYSEREGSPRDIVVNEAYDFEYEAHFVSSEIKHLHNKGVSYDEIAVLYRSNVISRNFELSFIENKIPYTIFGGVSYLKRREVKDVLSYIKFVINPDNFNHFKRIINQPSRGIGDKTIGKIKDLMDSESISLFDAIFKINETSPSSKSQVLVEFTKMVEFLQEKLNELPLIEFYDYLLDVTGYLEFIKQEDNQEIDREANLKEFKSILYTIDQTHPELSNVDKLKIGFDDVILDESVGLPEEKSGVTLSTIHSVKGLEFKYVFVVALEEGLFPLMRDDSDIEEERRIAYVAFTRAKEKIYLTCANRRLIYGRTVRNMKSRFLKEYLLPQEISASVEAAKVDDVAPGEIKVGDRVRHNNFGDGLVISTDDMTVQILFEKDNSLRRIMKGHQGLIKINKHE